MIETNATRSLLTSTFEIHPSNFAFLPGQLFCGTQFLACLRFMWGNEPAGDCRAASQLPLA